MTRRSWCATAALALAALALAATSRLAAAAPDPDAGLPQGRLKFRVFGGADGLKNLVIVDLAQDLQGQLWLGTDDGVYRYDGARFSHFTTRDGLTSGVIYALGLGPDGNVCVGSNTGLACWDGARFVAPPGLPAVRIRAVTNFDGALWVATAGAGLYTSTASGAMIPAPRWPGTPDTHTLWADAVGVVAGNDADVLTLGKDGAWRSLGELGLGHERLEDLVRDSHNTLWLRSATKLWQLPPGASRAIDVSAGLPRSHSLSEASHTIVEGPHGEILVATDAGVVIREHGGWRLLDRGNGSATVAARTVLVDREQTLWIGSTGLVQVRGRSLIERYDASTGLRGDVVWSFGRDRAGALWVGSSECLQHAVDLRWVCLPETEGRVVRAFAFAPGGGVFVGGTPTDLIYIDPSGRAVSLEEGSLNPDRTILAMAFSAAGDLWIASRGGLYQLPGGAPGTPRLVEIPGTQRHGRFSALAMVRDQVWATTTEGLVVLDHGAWHKLGAADGFRNSDIKYLVPRSDGRLCAAYNEGLGVTCFRYAQGRVSALEHIDETGGLSSNVVYFLGEDHWQRLWIGTGDGVDVDVARPGEPPRIEHFDENDGLAGNDSAARAFLADADGSIWMGASGGATHMLAQHYAGPPLPPQVMVLGGRLGDTVLSSRAATSATDLVTAHDRNALRLELAASTLLDAQRVEYQTRLSPLESEWTVTHHQRQVQYPALLPGSYRFEVRARIDAGSWGPVTELPFVVRAAWWQSGWFLGGLGVLGLCAIAGGFGWRQRRILVQRTNQLHAQSETAFRAVIDQMPDLISVHRNYETVYLNRASRRFLGMADADRQMRRAGLLSHLHPDDNAAVMALFDKVRDMPPEHPSEIIEMRFRATDGSWRTCEVWGLLIVLAGRRTVVAAARDVTERKRMRAQLLVADRMASLGTLAAGIAHEINNPLAYVTGNLEAMAETLAANDALTLSQREEVKAAIGDARDGAERVRRIVLGLRSFSRSDEEERKPLALADVLEAAIRMTRNELRHRAVLVKELGPVPMVVADGGRLTQVFINLLVNAAHAIHEGHTDANRITVRTRTASDGRAVVEIEDTGHGISPEVASRVFDPFFTTKGVGVGTGLGLSICHGIISGLGGQITLESVATGRGTVVRVVLPPVPEAQAQGQGVVAAVAPEPSAPVVVTRRPRLLLVDDELLVAQTMDRLLRRDYDTTIVLRGQDALDRIARGERFDAIVSDVMMPNMTGIELYDQLELAWPGQARRVIFLSGGAFVVQTRDRLDQIGAPQLEKPVTAKQLRAALQQTIAEAGLVELVPVDDEGGDTLAGDTISVTRPESLAG